MHRTSITAVIALACFAAMPLNQAQARNDLVLHALLGGVGGLLGALTLEAIDQSRRQPSYVAPLQGSVSIEPTYSYSVPSRGRSGVRYNQPCSGFDPSTVRLLAC
ncbi:hypothetical protein [Bosea sp. BH3]|uniref:hypothetical protein n=1 Tax=Bosea sp. BH3 TaxID=2871701 RepID=UPI0021CB0BC0|nr:hypothetical protein [Bosea sp. BH3]MCU4179137.1 hypothetical protein [Bosea sp. BH3]